MSKQHSLAPFLKWAGGKRWLFSDEFSRRLPTFDRYIEPFLGGGAGFFALRPKQSILSDLNPELISLYEAVRDFPAELRSFLVAHQDAHSDAHYYEVRANVPTREVERAARMLYLNRTCWNGLYRLNRSGEFNVPIGTKTNVVLTTDDFVAASARLASATLLVSDFEPVIDDAADGDLVFVDPPYTVRHNMNGFVKYNEKIFSWADQVRLAAAVNRAANRGAAVIVSNADHPSVRELYSGIGTLETAHRSSIISGKAAGRAPTTELIVWL